MLRKRINETRGMASQSGYDFREITSALSELDDMIPDYVAMDEMGSDELDDFEEEWNGKSALYLLEPDMENIEEVLENNLFNDKRIVKKWNKTGDSRGVITYTAEFKNLTNMQTWNIEVDFEENEIDLIPAM